MRKFGISFMVFLMVFAEAAILANLDVSLDNVYPDPMVLGKKGVVTFNVQNKAQSTVAVTADQASDVDIKIFLASGCGTVLGDTELNIGALDASESRDISIEFTPCKIQDAGAVRFKFEIGYTDSEGNHGTDQHITVPVPGTIDFAISSYSIESLTSGQSSLLKVKFKNNGDAVARDVSIKLVSGEATVTEGVITAVESGTFVPIGRQEIFIGDIGSGETIERNFEVFVNDPGQTSSYPLTFVMSYKDLTGVKFWDPLYLRLQTKNTPDVIKILGYTLDPEEVMPGDFVKLTITLKNAGDSVINDATLKIVKPETQVSSQSSILTGAAMGSDDVNPFVPVGPSEIFIGQILSQETKEISFQVAVTGDLPAGTYPLALLVEYANSQNKVQEVIRKEVGIPVFGDAEINVGVREMEPEVVIVDGPLTRIAMEIANVGCCSAKYLIAESRSDGFTISPHSVYIGTLDPDDFDSIDFEVTTAKLSPGTHDIEITFRYKDSFNREKTESRKFPVKVVPKSDEGKYIQSSGNTMYMIVGGIAVIAIVIFFLKKKFGK